MNLAIWNFWGQNPGTSTKSFDDIFRWPCAFADALAIFSGLWWLQGYLVSRFRGFQYKPVFCLNSQGSVTLRDLHEKTVRLFAAFCGGVATTRSNRTELAKNRSAGSWFLSATITSARLNSGRNSIRKKSISGFWKDLSQFLARKNN